MHSSILACRRVCVCDTHTHTHTHTHGLWDVSPNDKAIDFNEAMYVCLCICTHVYMLMNQ